MPSFPRTTYWSYFLFSSVYSYHLWHRLIDHRCVGLFLCFLSSSVDLYFIFVPKPYCYDDCSFVLGWQKTLFFHVTEKQTKTFLGQANSIVWSQGASFLQLCFFLTSWLHWLFRVFCLSLKIKKKIVLVLWKNALVI